MKDKVLRIGLLGPFGGGNLGDAASIEAVIQNIRKYYPDALIYGFSENPDDTQARHGIPSFRIGRGWREAHNLRNRLSKIVGNWLLAQPIRPLRKLERWVRRAPIEFDLLVEAYRNLGKLDTLIICGGGQLIDFWGGPLSHPYVLFRFAVLSRLRGARFIFLNVGAGPITHWLSKILIRIALSLASYRSYRDEYSKEYVAKVIGFKRDDPVFPDLAFSMDIPVQSMTNTHKSPVVAIGLMTYFDARVWPEKDDQIYAGYLEKLAEFSVWLLENGRSIRFIIGEAVHDRRVVDDLCCLLETRGWNTSNGQIIHEPILTTNELTRQIQCSDFVLGSRFHNIVLAQILNRPHIALSYHPKLDALMEDMNLTSYCLPLAQYEVEDLKERYKELEVNCEQIKAQLSIRVDQYRQLLDKEFQVIGEL